MQLRNHRGLIAVNLALLALLAAVTLAPHAVAQRAGTRARGEYALVGGKIQGGNANAVYVIDGANQEMIALRWNETTKALEGVGYRDLLADGEAVPGR